MRLIKWKVLMVTTALVLSSIGSHGKMASASDDQSSESNLTSEANTLLRSRALIGNTFQPIVPLSSRIFVTFDREFLVGEVLLLELQFLLVYNVLAKLSCVGGQRTLLVVTIETMQVRRRSLGTSAIRATGTCRGCPGGSKLYNQGSRRHRMLDLTNSKDGRGEKDMTKAKSGINTTGVRDPQNQLVKNRRLGIGDSGGATQCLGPTPEDFIAAYNNAIAKLFNKGLIISPLFVSNLIEVDGD